MPFVFLYSVQRLCALRDAAFRVHVEALVDDIHWKDIGARLHFPHCVECRPDPSILFSLCDTDLQPPDYTAGVVPVNLSPGPDIVSGRTGLRRPLLSHLQRFSK